MMRRLALPLLILAGAHTGLYAAPTAEEQALSAFVKIYKESKTHRQLIRKMPGFGPGAEEVHAHILGADMDSPLPKMDFDLSKKALRFDKLNYRLIDGKEGRFSLNGREYKWDRKLTYYQNWEHLQRQVDEPPTKSAGLSQWLWPEAEAQNRSFFPSPSVAEQAYVGGNTSLPSKAVAAADVGYLGYAAKLTSKGGTVVRQGLKLGPKIANIAGAVYITDFAVNFLHGRYYAESCDKQKETLKQIMNSQKISLNKIDCHWELGDRDNNISFFTPDGKLLPMVVNWESSTAWVSKDEVYKFGFSELKEVRTRTGEVLTSGPKFEEYKKNLEPYRRVLYEMGINNSCFGCATDFANHLTKTQPGSYSTDSAPAPAAPKTTN